MSEIYQTTDYEKFIFLPRNRNISVNNLLESVRKKNMLSSHPILVNENMEIIDGQHRLEVARILKVPIYYIIDSTISEEDIPTCQVQRTWCMKDYLKFYENKNEDYKFVKYCVDYFKIETNNIVRMFGASHANCYRKFKNGTFVINKDKEKLLIQLQNFIEIKDALSKLLSKRIRSSTSEALWLLVRSEDYNQNTMLRKIDLYPDEALFALKFHDYTHCLEQLKNLYNKGAKSQKIA